MAITRQCWQCRTRYEPTQTHQRYCGSVCRRQRERALARAVRHVLAGPSADPPRPVDGNLSSWVAEIRSRLAETWDLHNHLAGRAMPGDPYRPARDDDARIPISDGHSAFAQAVAVEVRRLAELRTTAEQLQADAAVRATPTPGSARRLEQVEQRLRWADQVSGVDDDGGS